MNESDYVIDRLGAEWTGRGIENLIRYTYSGYVDLLKKDGASYRPTWKQAIFGKGIDAVWYRKLNGVYVTSEGKEYEALIYSEDPVGSFPIIIKVPAIERTVVFNKFGVLTAEPIPKEELDICFSVFDHISLRLSEH